MNAVTRSGANELHGSLFEFVRNDRLDVRSGLGAWIVGGWQLNGIWTAQSGPPLNIGYSATSLNAPGNGNRPNINGPLRIPGGIGRGVRWFDTSVFSAPPPATFGNLGRNILSGPGFVNLDFSAFRKFPIRERAPAELRMESFNFTNTPHFSNPGSTFGAAGFGEVTTAAQDQRQFQFALKVTF